MRHYVYNSALRDAAVALLGKVGEALRVVCVGGDARDIHVLRTAGEVAVIADLAEEGALAGQDVVLAKFDTAPLLVGAAPLALCFSGKGDEFNGAALQSLAALEARGYEVVSHQAAAAEFGKASEHAFIFLRRNEKHSRADRLKRIIVLDAMSLQTRAGEEIAAYNAEAGEEDQLDAKLLDRVFEVGAFVEAGATGQVGLPAAEEGEESAYSSTPAMVYDAATISGRALSVHFDARTLPDWPAQARRLAAEIVNPQFVEVIVAASESEETRAHVTTLSARGIMVKFAPMAPLDARAWDDCFLARTAPEAQLTVYYGGPRAPKTAGWDWDLLRMAQNIDGAVFALKISPNKTRYVSTAADALKAAEGCPIVSRAWLKASGKWSRGALRPHQFQALAAYYFDAVDWMNKHRKLRLAPVMTVGTELLGAEEQPHEAFNAAPPKQWPFSLEGREAIRVGLALHAEDWAAEHKVKELTLRYSSTPGRVTLKAKAEGGLAARWYSSRQSFMPPL